MMMMVRRERLGPGVEPSCGPRGVLAMSMLSPLEREHVGDRLREQAAVLRLLGQELMRSLGESAGRMAVTEDEVVRVHEEIARCGVSVVAAQALEHAECSRLFAEHERREQQRWSARGEED